MFKVEDVLSDKLSIEKKAVVHWMGEVPTRCQLSDRKLTNGFVDGRVPGDGRWAIVHPAVFKAMGGKLGLGSGQRYEKQPSGRWLKVEG